MLSFFFVSFLDASSCSISSFSLLSTFCFFLGSPKLSFIFPLSFWSSFSRFRLWIIDFSSCTCSVFNLSSNSSAIFFFFSSFDGSNASGRSWKVNSSFISSVKIFFFFLLGILFSGSKLTFILTELFKSFMLSFFLVSTFNSSSFSFSSSSLLSTISLLSFFSFWLVFSTLDFMIMFSSSLLFIFFLSSNTSETFFLISFPEISLSSLLSLM